MDPSDSPTKTRPVIDATSYREHFLQKQNQGAMESIARELNRPLSEIATLYATIFDNLKSRARVTDYLPIIVARTVRRHYQNSVAH